MPKQRLSQPRGEATNEEGRESREGLENEERNQKIGSHKNDSNTASPKKQNNLAKKREIHFFG